MNELNAYILRLILCGAMVSLGGSLLKSPRTKRAAALCGGCLLLLTALGPLVRVDLTRIPDGLSDLLGRRAEDLAEAREKNDAILRALVEDQTEAWLAARGEALGADCDFSVTAEAREAGLWVPVAVEIRGTWTPDQRQALARAMEEDLGIPPDRQRWVP